MKLLRHLAFPAIILSAGCGKQEVSQTSSSQPTPLPSAAPSAPIVEATPQPVVAATPVPRLAPEGVFYLLRPVSLTTESGVYSARAGSRMLLVDKTERAWFVTDDRGTQFSVHPSDLTNDLDIAAKFHRPPPVETAVSTAPVTNLPTATPAPEPAPVVAAEPEPPVAHVPEPEPMPEVAPVRDYVTRHKIKNLQAQIYYSNQELAEKQAQLDQVLNARAEGGRINRVYYYAGSPYSYAHSRKITSSNGSEFVLKKEIDLLNRKLDTLKVQLEALLAE